MNFHAGDAPPYAEAMLVDEVPLSGLKRLQDINPMVGPARTGSKRFWSHPELKVLRETYPTGGVEACLPLLTGRSVNAILNQVKVQRIGRLTPAGAARRPRQTYTTSAAIDEAIRQVYQVRPSRGASKALCLRINRPQHWVTKRATALGYVVPRYKAADWSEAEVAFLREEGEHHDPAALSRMLRKRGFDRTPAAVSQRLKRLRIFREVDDGVYTAVGLAVAFGINRAQVVRWIDKGWLKARRKPAGHAAEGNDPTDRAWHITRKHVRDFVIDNVAAVDFHKVDKHWLVELLADASLGRPARGGGAA